MTLFRWRFAAVITTALVSLCLVNANQAASAAAGSDTLRRGETLTANQSLVSRDGRFRLIMQNDGNLVLYRSGGSAVWDTRTAGQSGARAVMQGDGNFVLYVGSRAIFASGTDGTSANSVVVQNDANLVMYGGGRAWWDRTRGALDRLRGSTSGSNQMDPGQCTRYAYDRFKQHSGVYPNLARANAKDFDNQARARGWRVVNWPAANSIVVFEPNVHGADSQSGHVAWVTGINGLSINITEMNRVRPYEVTPRTVTHTAGMSYILAP